MFMNGWYGKLLADRWQTACFHVLGQRQLSPAADISALISTQIKIRRAGQELAQAKRRLLYKGCRTDCSILAERRRPFLT
jgi:hypothetical protein